MDVQKEQDSKFESSNRYTHYLKNKKQIMVNNFIGGLSWALGSVVGLAVIAAIVGLVLNFVDFKLILGEWLGGMIKESLTQLESIKK